MCKFADVIRRDIYKSIYDSKGTITIDDVLSDLDDGERYTVYVNLGRKSVSSYINGRIQNGFIHKDRYGRLSLKEKGERKYHEFERILNISGSKEDWLELRGYAQP